MFRIASKDTAYPAPVVIDVPQPDGAYVRQDFTAHFRISRDPGLNKMLDREYLAEVLAGWDELLGEDGAALEFSPETRDSLAEIAYFATAIGRAYRAFTHAAALKNLEPLPENSKIQ